MLVFFSPGEGWPPSPKYVCLAPSSELYFTPIVVDNDSSGMHSRPYHSCSVACVMQMWEVHAIGHDPGDVGMDIPLKSKRNIVKFMAAHVSMHKPVDSEVQNRNGVRGP